MKFRGLPHAMHVGCVDVRPVSKLTLPLLPCGFCKFFNCEYFMCDRGHVTCVDCGTDELKQVGVDKLESSCSGCGGRVTLRRTRIPGSHLCYEKFFCPCGFLGTLGDIKKHLHSSEDLTFCVVEEKSTDEMDINSFKRTLLDMQQFRVAVDNLDSQMASFFDVHLAKPNHILNDHFENSDYVFGLEEKVKSIDALAGEVARLNNEMRPTMEMIFRGDSWVVVKIEKLYSTDCLKVAIDGIPLEIRFQQVKIEDEVWLGFYLRGSAHKIESSRRGVLYPLKTRVIIRVHDIKGHEFRKTAVRTFHRGRFTSPSFEDPKIERTNFIGATKFIPTNKINSTTIVRNGQVHFSLKFEPLHGN